MWFKTFLASLLSAVVGKGEPVSAIPRRRIEAVTVSRSEKALGYYLGGANYWRG